MSAKGKPVLTPEQKRARDIRRGVLLAHIVIEILVVIGCQLSWWSVYAHGELVSQSLGRELAQMDPPWFQPRWITLAAVTAFFFTSYDLVVDADIQWPPLLASAFALGCAGQVTYTLLKDEHMIGRAAEGFVRKELRERRTAPVTSATGDSGVAVVQSGTNTRDGNEPALRLKFDIGLDLALFGSFSMVLLSSYLTFFARRDT